MMIRVDASRAMGTGHLHRSIALAHALRAQGDDVAFVTRDLGLDSGATLARAGFDAVTILPRPSTDSLESDPDIPHSDWAEVPQSQDMDETAQAAKAHAPDWVVVDSYAFDARWHHSVSTALDRPIAAIDDVADRAMACDLIVDHTYAPDHAAKYEKAIDPAKARLLGGPSYALLGPAFAEAPRAVFCDKVRSIGVFMGGVDAGDHTSAALDGVELAGFQGPVEVVTTSANPGLTRLKARVEARANTKLSLNQPDLAGFFARHDLQIGAGGGATWERCCLGAPTLLVVVAANQNAVAKPLADDGVVALAPEPTAQAIAGPLSALIEDPERRRALAEKSRALVDGCGAARVAREMRDG